MNPIDNECCANCTHFDNGGCPTYTRHCICVMDCFADWPETIRCIALTARCNRYEKDWKGEMISDKRTRSMG